MGARSGRRHGLAGREILCGFWAVDSSRCTLCPQGVLFYPERDDDDAHPARGKGAASSSSSSSKKDHHRGVGGGGVDSGGGGVLFYPERDDDDDDAHPTASRYLGAMRRGFLYMSEGSELSSIPGVRREEQERTNFFEGRGRTRDRGLGAGGEDIDDGSAAFGGPGQFLDSGGPAGGPATPAPTDGFATAPPLLFAPML